MWGGVETETRAERMILTVPRMQGEDPPPPPQDDDADHDRIPLPCRSSQAPVPPQRVTRRKDTITEESEEGSKSVLDVLKEAGERKQQETASSRGKRGQSPCTGQV